jgi:hypothetical protein
MPKYLLLKHYRGGPAPHHPFPPMDQWAPEDVEALPVWPEHPPRDPSAWLATVATRRLVDARGSGAARHRREEASTPSRGRAGPLPRRATTPSSCSSAAATPTSRPPPRWR